MKNINIPFNSKQQLSTNLVSGFTLVEMLIVMVIIMALSTMSVSSFVGLKRSIVLNETITNFQQVVRNTQRSSMLLARSSDEKWIYGTGIDLTHIEEVDGYYTTFKWCSPFNIYGENYFDISYKYATSKFPAYNPNIDLSIPSVSGVNGVFPVNQLSSLGNCTLSDTYTYQGGFSRLEDGISKKIKSPIIAEVRDNKGTTTSNYKIAYIVFESISGRTFFYNSDGVILNYDKKGNMVENPVNLDIVFSTDVTPINYVVNIKNVSGKVSLNREDTSHVGK